MKRISILAISLATTFLIAAPASAKWSGIKCQFKCTAKACGSNPSFGKQCLDECGEGSSSVKNCKAAYDKTMANQADVAKAAANKAAAEKAEAEMKAGAEKAKAEKDAVAKAAADKEAADKALAEKVAAEKTASDKLAADKEAAQKESDKSASDAKLAADQAEEKKAADEKAKAQKEVAEKAAAQKAEADLVEVNKAVMHKAVEVVLTRIVAPVKERMDNGLKFCATMKKMCDAQKAKGASDEENEKSIKAYKDKCDEGGEMHKICTDAVNDMATIQAEEAELKNSGKIGDVTMARAREFGIIKDKE